MVKIQTVQKELSESLSPFCPNLTIPCPRGNYSYYFSFTYTHNILSPTFYL